MNRARRETGSDDGPESRHQRGEEAVGHLLLRGPRPGRHDLDREVRVELLEWQAIGSGEVDFARERRG